MRRLLGKKGRPPPIILTTPTNLIQLQKQLKNVVPETFEFHNTRNGTRVLTKSLADFQSVKSYFDLRQLSYFSFFSKSEKPIKAVIRHLPINTPAEDISDGLVNLAFDVISVKKLTTTRRSAADDPKSSNLHLFLITLPRSEKLQEIFRLPSICHIAFKVEVYRARNGLTQCHNCQQFGHVWANYKQAPRCLWCGGGHLHKKCPEKENASSTPACCNCKLAEGEKPHPANYRGCSHAKEELQRKRPQKSPKPTTGRAFTSTLAAPGVSFAAALRGGRQQPQAPATAVVEKLSSSAATPQQPTGQSAQTSNVNSLPLDNMLRAITVVQQIMTELSGAVSKQDQIMAITKIVLNLMEQNGH
jgi:hypothetical protein